MLDVKGQIIDVPIAKIEIRNRQRQDLGDIISLELSIESKGLIYPIVVQPITEGNDTFYILVAGERRLTAFKNLGKETIPAIFRENLDDLSRKELELEENYRRKNLNYLEEARAVAELDRLKRERYGSALPGRFGRGGWSRKDTAQALGISEGKVSEDIGLAEAAEHHANVREAKTRRDALKELRRIQQGALGAFGANETLEAIRKNCAVLLPEDALRKIDPGTVDLLLHDITEGYSEETFKLIQKVLKPLGSGYIFLPLESLTAVFYLLDDLKLYHQKKPFIWHVKGRDDYVPFIWLSKNLISPPKGLPLHISQGGVINAVHTLAKPYTLFWVLIQNTTQKGEFVLELSAYSVEAVKAAADLGRNISSYYRSDVLYKQVIAGLRLELEKEIR